MLRSDSPDRPMTMRRQHWLLHETRFLFLTRKGPVEFIVKPGVIIGGAFVGIVGASVIAATTLFLGFKSVEVVRNESITTAEANMPPALQDDILAGTLADPLAMETTDLPRPAATPNPAAASEPLAALGPAPVLEPAIEPVQTAALITPAISWPPSIAATDAVPEIIIPTPLPKDEANGASTDLQPSNLNEPDMMVPVPDTPASALAGAGNAASDDNSGTADASNPGENSAATQDDTDDMAVAALPDDSNSSSENTVLARTMALMARLTTVPPAPVPTTPTPTAPTVPAPSVPAPADPAIEGGLETDMAGNQPPVLTRAGRELKVLRSMAREVRNIRSSLGGLGLDIAVMPQIEDIDQLVETEDFVRLAMAVEDHRSMLRKIPLKPPMLYFYISSEYGLRKHPVLKTKRFHHGIDLAGTWQETVQATAPGTVIFAGNKGSFGKIVQVQHAYGIITTYAHLSKITVRKGADVTVGTVVGRMGRTGRVDGAHLHYEIRIGEKSLDPRSFFAIGHQIGVGGELLRAAD